MLLLVKLNGTADHGSKRSIYMATPKYNASFISAILKRSLYTGFSTFSEGKLNSRVMVFAADHDLKYFYCVTNKTTEKMAEIGKNPYCNMLVLSTSDRLDGMSETQIHGTAQVFCKMTDKEVKTGLELLSEKSSMISTVKDSGSLGDFCILKIKTSEISFRIYKDILQNIPKTILTF